MIRLNSIRLPLAYTDDDVKTAAAKELRVSPGAIRSASLFRRSVDARHRNDVHYITSIDVHLNVNESTAVLKSKSKNASLTPAYRYVPKTAKDTKKRPLIVGMGPAGLFCALTLARAGIRPIVIERGGDVDARAGKISLFFGGGALDTETNVQFGEGGAGAFSDGKLNTGTKDPRARQVLIEFASHGAPDEILVDAKPHIGTDRLRPTIKNIRQELLSLGADIRFNTRLVGLSVKNGAVTAAEVEHLGVKETVEASEVVLAVGHSARDTFELILSLGIVMEPKPFSVGVRIEHLRESIDRSRYGDARRLLPAASYKESVHLKDGRGVYTFCMCPGGQVVAAASEENTVVTNGMSEFARDKVNSNAGLLVSVTPDDVRGENVLKGMYFQRDLEKKAFLFGGGDYRAPVQRVGDFLNGEPSHRFGDVLPSYLPGASFSKMENILPAFVTDSIRAALPLFEKKLRGFSHPDALLTAVESRSSSPVRILRDETLESVSVKGLYPCGEGAGYAGGIVSAAVDGMKVAEKIIEK